MAFLFFHQGENGCSVCLVVPANDMTVDTKGIQTRRLDVRLLNV